MTEALTCVKRFANRQEAELARGALEASGIESMLVADDGGGELPGLDFAQSVGLFVQEKDLEAATTLLDPED
jgi:hypothetical protein